MVNTLVAHTSAQRTKTRGKIGGAVSLAQSASGSAFLLAYSDIRGFQSGNIGGDVRVLDAETSPYGNWKAAFNGITQCMARVSNATSRGALITRIRHDYYSTTSVGGIGLQPKHIEFYISSYTGSDSNAAINSVWTLAQRFTGTQVAGVYSNTFEFDNPLQVANGNWIKVRMYDNFVGNKFVCTNGIYVTAVSL